MCVCVVCVCVCVYVSKQALTLNNLRVLICQNKQTKKKKNATNQSNYFFLFIAVNFLTDDNLSYYN